MNNKYIWWIAIAVLVIILVFGIYKIATATEVLSCPVGQKVASVLVTPAVPAIPAVTHQACPTSDSAYTSSSHRECSRYMDHPIHDWRYANKITIIDTPAIPAVPAVYADQCVTDTEYVAPTPEPTPAPKVSSGGSSQGGHRKCGITGLPTCEEWVKTLGQGNVGGSPSLEQQLVDLLNQLIVLLQKQIALQ
jgi:hypothetical protein